MKKTINNMRKVIFQINVSLDGFITGPDGAMDWFVWDDELSKRATDILDSGDIILLGRVLADEFLRYWPNDTTEFAGKINRLPKIVFSTTLDKVEYPNVTLVKENVAEEVMKLKQQPGKNIVLYGGAGLAQTFMRLNLIDEYHLFVNPVILGSGLHLYMGLDEKLNLKLIHSKTTPSGVTILCYEPGRK